jgi:GNAT superfamily N-acetyltransferase
MSWAATFPSLRHPWPLEQWRARFEDKLVDGARIFIAEDSERALVLGFVLLFENVGRLDQIFVRPGKQGQGVGTALLLLAKRRCPSGLHLDTLLANERARRFYERHGFTAGRTGVNAVNGQPKVEYRWTPKGPWV